jgi:hypothetical protein
VTSFDLDRLLVPSGITGLQDHLALVYTLDCTYDGSPQRRVLVLLDANGGETLRLRGSTRDPANPWGPHELPKDHRYDPGRDAYLSVKGGDVPDGRIVDHAELDALPAAFRDTLMALWWEAFHRP